MEETLQTKGGCERLCMVGCVVLEFVLSNLFSKNPIVQLPFKLIHWLTVVSPPTCGPEHSIFDKSREAPDKYRVDQVMAALPCHY